jgi:hypothetical protein
MRTLACIGENIKSTHRKLLNCSPIAGDIGERDVLRQLGDRDWGVDWKRRWFITTCTNTGDCLLQSKLCRRQWIPGTESAAKGRYSERMCGSVTARLLHALICEWWRGRLSAGLTEPKRHTADECSIPTRCKGTIEGVEEATGAITSHKPAGRHISQKHRLQHNGR